MEIKESIRQVTTPYGAEYQMGERVANVHQQRIPNK